MASTLTASEFIQNFHSVTGTTIGERRKIVFQLLHQALENKLNIDFAQLQPKTPLEENFKLDTLIYFNNNVNLLLVLTKENPILVHKVVKKASPLLVLELCRLTSVELLHFLSQISLNAKLKLLNKCGEQMDNTQKAEEFFSAIKDKYGIYLATKLIIACSPEFIIGFLESTRFKFTSRQFLILVKKYPHYTRRLLEILHKHVNIVQDYRNTFKYLARHNVPLFIELNKTYNIDALSLGRRATHNFIKHNKTDVINNAKVYSDILKDKYIKESLSAEDYNLFYYGLFPPLLAQFDKSYEQILKLAPNLEVLLQGFYHTYNTELLNEPKFITPKLLQIMPNEIRLKTIKPEYKPSDLTEDEWTCYLSTSDAIALLKKRIFLTSDIKNRATLISLLVDTCHINKDEAALLEMCNYMVKQHRNDHISVRLGFLRTIKKSYKLENLNMAHWGPINELIQIFQLNGEEFFHIEDFLIAYIECCLKNKQPITEPLTAVLKRRTFWGSWNLLTTKSAYEKSCLQTIPTILTEIGGDMINNNLAYFNALINWNKRHPKDKFSVCDGTDFVDCLQKSSKKQGVASLRYCETLIAHVLHTKTISERQVLIESYMSYINVDKIRWFIHSNTNFLINNLSICVNAVLKSSTCTDSFWLYCKLYSHLDLPQKIIDICLHSLSQELPDDKKLIRKNALTALSHLMPTATLLALNFKVGSYMKNCVLDFFLIETILKYCLANSLASIKRTIFSVMNNLKEENLLHLIQQLAKIKNVHVRKIALYILFRTMEKQTIMKILKQFIAEPDNATLNKFILFTVFKYFTKNPNDYVWNLIQLSTEALDPDDEEAYNLLLQPNKIPDGFLTPYTLFMWKMVEKLPGSFNDNSSKLLHTAKPHLLPHEFSEELIEKYFFKYNKNYATFYVELQAFVCKYICYKPLKLEEYVAKVLLFFNTTDLRLRAYVNHFVKQMCYECIIQNNRNVLMQFSEQWNNSAQPYEMFVEYLYIQLSLIKIEHLNIPEIGSRLACLCISLTDNYGCAFLYPFAQEIKTLSELYFIKGSNDEETEINRFTLVESIVKFNDNFVLAILAILLLKDYQPKLIETKNKYDALTDCFKKRPEPEVCVYLNDFHME